MLNKFDVALKENKENDMKILAKTLFQFNGGNSCVQAYINYNEIFMWNMGIIPEVDIVDKFEYILFILRDDEVEEDVRWVNIPPPEQNLIGLLTKIRKTVLDDWNIIFHTFPNFEVSQLLIN